MRRNTRKELERHPDMNGSCMIEGVEYWISGWVKKNDDGTTWLSLAFKPKEPKPEAAIFPERKEPDGPSDDLPF